MSLEQVYNNLSGFVAALDNDVRDIFSFFLFWCFKNQDQRDVTEAAMFTAPASALFVYGGGLCMFLILRSIYACAGELNFPCLSLHHHFSLPDAFQ